MEKELDHDKIIEQLHLLNVEDFAVIKPTEIKDIKNRIKISVSPYYSIITINDRHYYFIRETGEYDGWSQNTRENFR